MAAALDFSYGAPDISEEGDHVSWSWTVTNTGDAPATDATFTSRLTPALKVTSTSGDGKSTLAPGLVTTTFATVVPGETLEGSLDADLPEDLSGSAVIAGRITWQK